MNTHTDFHDIVDYYPDFNDEETQGQRVKMV